MSDVKYAVRFANDLMERFPDPNDYPFKSWCYAQGFYLWGFIKLYEKTGEERYRQYVESYGRRHVQEDGSVPGFRGDSLDDIMPGSVLCWLYEKTKDPRYEKACRSIRKSFDDYPRLYEGSFYHAKGLTGQLWVDGLFMGGMFLLRYGKVFGDRTCFDEVVKQLTLAFKYCRKDSTGLLYHAYDETGRTSWSSPVDGRSREVWSEGLGWYALILAEAADILPRETARRDEVMEQYNALARDLCKVQAGENVGLWYQVVDKPGLAENFHDTSGSAMFTYSLKRGLDLGVLKGTVMEQSVINGYRGIQSKVVDGLGGLHVLDACNGLGVQDSYADYVHFPKTVDAQEAVAAVLWALTAE